MQTSRVSLTLSTMTCLATSRTTSTELVVLDVLEPPVPPFPSSPKVTPNWVVTCVRSCVRPTRPFLLSCRDSTEDLTDLTSDTVAVEAAVVEVVVAMVAEVEAVKPALTTCQWATVVSKLLNVKSFMYNIYLE